jgi:apolipoprotein N-acyltransferase
MNFLCVYLAFSAVVALGWSFFELRGQEKRNVARTLVFSLGVGLCSSFWIVYAMGCDLCRVANCLTD